MDIDEQLISQNTQSQEAELAGEFRASKRGEMQERGEDERASLRERIQQKRVQETKNFKEKYEGDGKTQLTNKVNPVREFTDGLLKAAWENLVTSWGLTLIYIDAHAFLNKVFGPKVFRELGEEWIPASYRRLEREAKQSMEMTKLVEKAGCCALNLGCLFIILFLLTMLSIIASILTGDVKLIWDLFLGLIEDIALLFS